MAAVCRYFNNRSFFDREKLLFRPGAERDGQTLREDALFEPGRSVLTADGRRNLDSVAAWFKKVRRPATEVVIAAFNDDGRDNDLAQLLSQEQAEAVRNYLVANHQIDSAGWLASRKVAAVGFGAEPPHTLAAAPRGQPPPRRAGWRSFCSRLRPEPNGLTVVPWSISLTGRRFASQPWRRCLRAEEKIPPWPPCLLSKGPTRVSGSS